MKLLILGNIGSGKSTYSRLLSESLNMPVVSIDKLRKVFGDGTLSKEYLAWSKFLEHCESERSLILEFTGGGPHKSAVKESLFKANNTVIVYIKSTVKVCSERIAGRKWDTPYAWNIPAEPYLPEIHKELETIWKNEFWKQSGIQALSISNIINSMDNLSSNSKINDPKVMENLTQIIKLSGGIS